MSKGLPKAKLGYSLMVKLRLVKKSGPGGNVPRGCMVIKPYGFSIWEKLQAESWTGFLKRPAISNA